jgi:hypothetical protein
MTEHVFCGQAWTTDELIDAGFDHYVFNEAGTAQIPHLPSGWPHCPMCDSPLRRIDTSQSWVCEPKTQESSC